MDNNTNLQAQPEKLVNKKSNKPYLIVLGCLVVVIFVLGAVDLGLFLNRKTDNSNQITQNVPEQKEKKNTEMSNGAKTPLEDLTKEEVLAAYAEMISSDYAGPKGMIDEEIIEGAEAPYFILEYSYDDPMEIIEEDYHISDFGKYELELTPIGDYATLVTANTEGVSKYELGSSLSGSLGIAFDKDYINYYQYEEKEDDVTQVMYETIFTDRSEDFLEKGLPLYYVATEASPLQSIYDYKLEIDDEKAELTVYNIGYGLNVGTNGDEGSSLDLQGGDPMSMDGLFAINLYTVQCVVDLDTGEFEWVKAGDGERNKIFKNYPLSNEEMEELASKMNAASLGF